MRSRRSRVISRVSVLCAATIAVLLAEATAASAGTTEAGATVLAAAPDAMTMPVGLIAVTLGLAGMLIGAFRKKKIQPENQRKH